MYYPEVNKRGFYILMFLLVGTAIVSASSCATLDDPVERNTNFQIYQTCNNCTFCNFSFFTPSDTIGVDYVADTEDNWRYYNNITSGNSSELGIYRYDYICGNLEEASTGCVELSVTASGDYFDQSQPIAILSQMGFIALLVTMGFTFRKEKWKLKTFFFISALLMALILLNSINIITGSSGGLYSMGQIGLVIGITIVSIMVMYFLVNITIELTTYFKKKKADKWSMNDYE